LNDATSYRRSKIIPLAP